MKSFRELREYWRPIRKKKKKIISRIYKKLKEFSLENKLEPTKAEIEFGKILSSLDYNFSYINQAILFKQKKKYIIDFVILHPYYLVFEIDGKYHNEKEQKLKDFIRDCFISKLGYKTIRFGNEDIFKNKEKIKKTILEEFTKQKELNKFCNIYNKKSNIFKGSVIKCCSKVKNVT
jgi:very-short-patch-repair endonuclease